MLTQTFCHVPGIGKRAEKALWQQGCRDWQTYLDNYREFSIGSASRELARRIVEESCEALDERHHQFFAQRLRQIDAWRAWPEFRESCVYLDIETDGSNHRHAVTTIGLYDGIEFLCLVQGEGLESFRDLISHYSMIVTFFGGGFDLPVLEKRFRGLVFDQIHLDLCPTLRKMGLKGGLKKIEKQVGITRGADVDGLTGRDAVFLWRKHLRGSPTALQTLIAYNRADVVNLEKLAEYAYSEQKRMLLGEQLVLF